MPYVFQKEIEKTYPHYTGCEKFDSLYHLNDIFKDSSYFLINIFFYLLHNLKLYINQTLFLYTIYTKPAE